MPSNTSIRTATDLPKLGQTTPKLPPITSARALTSDSDSSSNSGSASGADLLTRSLTNTSQINGQGGQIDVVA